MSKSINLNINDTNIGNESGKKKDKIFNQLCEQEAQRQAEKDYWENVRNELYLEQGNKKRKMEEQAEKEKRERQKEEMMASALLHKKIKEENKIKEQEKEKEFNKKIEELTKKIEEEEEFIRQSEEEKSRHFKNKNDSVTLGNTSSMNKKINQISESKYSLWF